MASMQAVSCMQVDDEDFREHLYIRPLPDGKVLSHFEFTTTGLHAHWEGLKVDASIASYQTNLLPRSLSAIIRSFDVEEVYLSLTSGRWDYTRWGETVGHGSPSGGEIYAWLSRFEGDNKSSIDKKWKGLTNALGGLFCSSLNKLDDKMTVSPTETFTPQNPSSEGQPFFHALLPLERPCTENLTPFLSLLPCRGAAGLAELLNPHRLFDANWQRLIVHVTKDVESGALTIKLSMEVVQDPVRMTLSAGSQRRRDWSFDKLFGRAIRHSCPVASSSRIVVDLAREDEEAGYSLEPKTSGLQLLSDSSATYDVSNAPLPLSLQMRWPVMRTEGFEFPTSYSPAPLYAERINTGYGLERAVLGIAIWNSEAFATNVTWLEEWPAWIKVYMHTLRVTIDNKEAPESDVVKKMLYRQAHTRGRPTLIEAHLAIPANSIVRILVDIDRAYLRYTDYPPDSARGFDVPSGVILSNRNGVHKRIYTTSTLLDMPEPDFSMPYNVIILTCTVIALFFGSVFNMMTRTWMLVDMRETPKKVEHAGKADELAQLNGAAVAPLTRQGVDDPSAPDAH